MSPIVNTPHINHLLQKDKVIAFIHNTFGAPPNWSRPQGFVSLSMIILEQQVSLASAKAHFNKLNNYINKFTPENILQLSDVEMRECQISRQKAKYLRCLSESILNKELDLLGLAGKREETIRKQLTTVKGIGNWTTDIYLMFCLQSKNIFPIGDIAVVNTMKKLYKLNSTDKILKQAQKWEPYRSLGTYFMWHHYLESRKK